MTPSPRTPDPVPDDIYLMVSMWLSGSETQRAVALEMARDNYLASRKDKVK